ncbi:MAG: hypothetical protein KIT37_14385 [Steroidobacteraceae bacterium]|nr:hypothetical protein [Steroidobacteraceae bacterium]
MSQLGRDGKFGPGLRLAALSLAGYDDLMPNVRMREERATLSHDGKRLYFGRNGDIFMSRRPAPGYAHHSNARLTARLRPGRE